MKYWAEEYHVDGFSLDLIDCVNVKYKGSSHVYKWLDEIKTSLAKEDANLVIWGDNYTKEERQNNRQHRWHLWRKKRKSRKNIQAESSNEIC